jgi:hypothetical protein
MWYRVHGSRAAGVAQEVEHLPSKHKALSSNPSTVEEKKKVHSELLNTTKANIKVRERGDPGGLNSMEYMPSEVLIYQDI